MIKRLIVALGLCTLFLPAAAAAQAPVKPAITISPFQHELSLGASGGDQGYELQVANNTKTVQEIGLSARDFGSLNDSGGLLLDGANSKDYSKKYGLASWISVGADTAVLEPGESRSITVTIQNRADLQPGGHYGAVVATVNSIDDKTGDKVLVNQQLLSLILVKKTGGEHYNLALKSITNDGNLLHVPNTVQLRFQNPGNVHVVPRGIVRLKSPGGKVLKTGIINSESAAVLPETFRQVYVPLISVRTAPPIPGPYTVEVEYRYDGIQKSAKKSQIVQFISLPTYFLLATVVAVSFAAYRLRKKPPVQLK